MDILHMQLHEWWVSTQNSMLREIEMLSVKIYLWNNQYVELRYGHMQVSEFYVNDVGAVSTVSVVNNSYTVDDSVSAIPLPNLL